MILTKSSAFTQEEIKKIRERFEVYVKTVIDIQQKICSAGGDRHFESEKILLDQGSKQENLWGGGLDAETLTIDCNSLINIRPRQGNASNEILNPQIRALYEELTKYFFRELYESK